MTDLKLCFLYENRFRNDGPPLYWFNAARKLGYNVTHLLPYSEKDIRKFGPFDYYFYIDWGQDALEQIGAISGVVETPHPSIGVFSDTHLGYDFRLQAAKKMDYVYCNQQRATLEFARDGVKEPVWLPHAVEPKAYPYYSIIKKWDVCFIGHLQEQLNYNGMDRVSAIDRIFKEFPNSYFGTRNPAAPEYNLFEDAAKKFAQSRIVFNISIGDDINMRLFESIATGSMLLTNWLPTLGALFGEGFDGKYFVTYRSYDEMVEKAKYYLEHEQEREQIAHRGRDLILEKHTYTERLKTVMNLLPHK